MPNIAVNGYSHYYKWITASGLSEPSGKPVLVFIHGWGGSLRYWESTAIALSPQFDCLLYDMRGFGRSRQSAPDPSTQSPDQSIEPGYELETYAEDLAALLDALKLQRVYLNAHSTGSSIAVFFLNLYPERVERAILTCSGIFEYDKKSFDAFHKFGGYVVKFRPRWLYGLPFMDKLFMQRFLHRPIAREIGQAFLEDFLMADQAAAIGTMMTAVSKKAAEVMPQEFSQLAVPTLLISGEHDVIIPAELGRRAAVLNEKVRHVVMPNTAHFPMLEDPETYLQQVKEFLGVSAPASV